MMLLHPHAGAALQSAQAHAAAMACAPSWPPPREPNLLGLWAAGLSQQAQTETFQDSQQGLYVLPLQVGRRRHPLFRQAALGCML